MLAFLIIMALPLLIGVVATRWIINRIVSTSLIHSHKITFLGFGVGFLLAAYSEYFFDVFFGPFFALPLLGLSLIFLILVPFQKHSDQPYFFSDSISIIALSLFFLILILIYLMLNGVLSLPRAPYAF